MYLAATIALVIVGLILLATSIKIVFNAFQESTAWGLLSFLVPFALYVYAIRFWTKNRRPLLIHLSMFPLAIVVVVVQTFTYTPF